MKDRKNVTFTHAVAIGQYGLRLAWDDSPDFVAHVSARRSYFCDFELYLAIMADEQGNLSYGRELQETVEAGSNGDLVAEKHSTVHGFVKWDGCTQLYFDDSPGPQLHFDDVTEFDELVNAIKNARAKAGEIVMLEE